MTIGVYKWAIRCTLVHVSFLESAKKQPLVSRSSTKSEYQSSHAISWPRMLFKELQLKFHCPPPPLSAGSKTDNIRDYAGLYTKDPFLALSFALCLLSLGGLPPLAGFFEKLHLFWCGWQAGLYFLVSIGLLTSVVSIYYYLKIIKLLITGQNQEIIPRVRNYRRSPLSLRSNNSIELSMIVCVIASTIPGISMNPIIEIAQDTLF
ncbi:hypothetical protein I3760_11G090800 [Carya illinoinensis]|nr:hypothetical protein I3760_11G090800 [Carya illinoinensis]